MAGKDDAVQHGVGRSFEILDQAWNAANAVGVASVFALDCVLVSPRGAVMDGREDVKRVFEAAFPTDLKGSRRETTITSTRNVGADIALFVGTITFSGVRDPSGAVGPSDYRTVITGAAHSTKEGWEILAAQATHVAV